MKITRKTVILILCHAAVLLLASFLLKTDSDIFVKWWIMSLAFGIGIYPLSSYLFSPFCDRGWIFSKAIGIALSGFAAFILIAIGAARFTSSFLTVSAAAIAAACWLIYFIKGKNKKISLKKEKAAIDIDLILFEELLFLSLFLMWAYFAGFNPQAYGTEKFMDYGFMASMARSDTLPARDMWYSLGNINYYYGGQYYAVFLTKLIRGEISKTYNLMRAFVAAFAFAMPFSIVYHLIKNLDALKPSAGDRTNAVTVRNGLAYLGGILSGAALSLAGNMHYVLYGLFGDVFKLSGYEDYWFPSSTRYIGHNPLTNDQCIHEFPSYSFVLGDLHAHVVNIMFVLCFIGILYAWFKKKDERAYEARQTIRELIFDPHIWILGIFLGIFQFNNYWDFVIYLTLGSIGIVLMSIRRRAFGIRAAFIKIPLLAAVSVIAALPFNMTFETMAQGLALAKDHSALYQIAVLWGLPVLGVVMLFIFASYRSIQKKRACSHGGYISNMTLSDMSALLFGICAIGLVLIPELVYIRDIYEEGYARGNTMFKLTYQAYILFGISFVYSIIRILSGAKTRVAKTASMVLLALFLLTCGYFLYAVNCWFGNVFSPSGYEGLDASAFLWTYFKEDAEAIFWLNENIDGSPAVLEAPGDSYSDYERVSAMTGLPTVVGWYVHEWLWRNDPADLNEKVADVETIYTSGDYAAVFDLIEKYDIEYIFVGKYEREKYENLNEAMIQSLGEIVFKGSIGENPAYIVKINRN